MNKFEDIITSITSRLLHVKYRGDLSDIGNEIGTIIAPYLDNDEMGYDLEGFISGVRHGVSLVDGTHDNPKKVKKKK